jgi:hypothetical protein
MPPVEGSDRLGSGGYADRPSASFSLAFDDELVTVITAALERIGLRRNTWKLRRKPIHRRQQYLVGVHDPLSAQRYCRSAAWLRA